ncbi:NADH-quinone oxidoreductase subunit N [Desulfopila sp. IMCC35008]|uniref:NADH-quinone oxidoreductase subunit N n=1 Tax=Desulfopila sp. IMCC35008 TaxID=2653858 RepID=UPI0013D0803B|nr:NADH-quinone oxidoreductase subunit N [Desulfopila sp. IMCC35008]
MLDFIVILPLLVVGAGAIILMLLSTMDNIREGNSTIVCLAMFAVAFAVQMATSLNGSITPYGSVFNGMMVASTFTKMAGLIILGCGFFSCMIAQTYFTKNKFCTPEFYSLMMFAACGMLLLTMAAELITVFIALEIMSLSIYVLVGYDRGSVKRSEAILKYLMLGAFAGGLFTMGAALIYGSAGSTRFEQIAVHLSESGALANPALIAGAFLVIVAFLFKAAAFPFHAWVVDVYDGAPLPVTGFMATAVKTAIFAVFANFLIIESSLKGVWVEYLFWIAVLTMFAGNLIAISQDNIKRMLAASGIVHTGYLLVALIALGTDGFSGGVIMFYLAAYAVSTLGIFAALSYLGGEGEKRNSFDHFKGLAKVRPYSAGAITIFLLSMAGIPPTAGFLGKFYIITDAIRAGYMLLAVLAIVSSVLSMWYYLRLVILMYFSEPEDSFETAGISLAPITTVVMAICVFVIGCFPVLF